MRTFVRRTARNLVVCALPFAVAASLVGCGQADEPYKPLPASSARKANVPAVPTLPAKAIKQGDAYTVYGAMHHLRSRVHNGDVNGKDISITGYIVKTNLADAPECAVHKTGKGDKDDCKAAIPAFWIADEKGDVANSIKVMGWASNYSQIFDAIQKYSVKSNTEAVKDEFWGADVPNPIPNTGAKVTVSGNFAVSFTKSTSGVETDPSHGIMTYSKMTYVEPPAEPGTLPGMPGGKGATAKKKK